ncbi:MAG: hypothetical protein AAFV32_09365 [Myxococcota bacterium]
MKFGIETISVLAGSVGLFSLGCENKLPLLLATLIALGLCAWGLFHLRDANYWSLRAIAFLANVEAIYFKKKDQVRLNAYAGLHPPFKLMNTFKFQVWLIWFVSASLNVAFFVIRADVRGPGGRSPWEGIVFVFLEDIQSGVVIVASAIAGLLLTKNAWGRSKDYENFVTSSPGPGLLTADHIARDVSFVEEDSTGETDADSPNKRQTKALESAQKSAKVFKHWTCFFGVAAVVTVITVLGTRIFHGST